MTSEKDFIPALPITVLLQPEEKILKVARKNARNVKRLLENLKLKQSTVIVVRKNILLTPDIALYAGDELIIRKIMSSG